MTHPSDLDALRPDLAGRARLADATMERLVHDLAGGEPSPERVLLHLCDAALNVCGAEGTAVLGVEDEQFRILQATGSGTPYRDQSFRIQPPPSLFREVIASRRARFTNDGAHDPRVDERFRRPLQLRNVAVAPIIVDGELTGLLAVVNTANPGGFDDALGSLIQRLADLSAVALRGARLVRVAEQAAREAREAAERAALTARRNAVLANAARTLASSRGADDAIAAIARLVGELDDVAGLAVYDADPASRRATLLFQAGAGRVDPRVAAETVWTGAVGSSIAAGTAVFLGALPDADPDREAAAIFASLRASGVGAVAMLPLVIDGRVGGVLGLRFTQPMDFPDDQRRFFGDLAAQVAVAVRNARLDAVRERERQLAEAAAGVARTALERRELFSACHGVLGSIAPVLHGRELALGLARARDGRLEYITATPALAPLVGHRPVGARGVLGVAPDGRPIRLASLRGEAADTAFASALPDHWVYVVPLIARTNAVGVLLVTGPPEAPLTEQEQHAASRLASPAALAVDALLLDDEERQARERERLLASALALLDDPVFILEEGRVRYANAAAMRTYRVDQRGLVGRDFRTLVADEVAATPEAAAPWRRAPALPEQRHRRDDGSLFPAIVTRSSLRSSDGASIGEVIAVRDMTSERAILDQLRQSEKMVALGELVAGVAHEINNPLTGISAFAELLLEESLAAEPREWVELIKRESDRAKVVMRDLLLFSRTADDDDGPVDVGAVVAQTLRLRAYALRTARIETVLDLPASLPAVRGDAQKLQQVVMNLLVNAEHAMQDCDRRVLSVAARRAEDAVVLTVADTGRGMPPEVQRRIFEPFFTTKPAGVGTGLGLSVSYGILKAHGGRIDVASTPEEGTCFTLTLPVSMAPPPGEDDTVAGERAL